MTRTVVGIYRKGIIELLELPEEIQEGPVTVILSQTEVDVSDRPGFWYGKYSKGRLSDEEDFKIAEWHGEDG